MSAPRQSFDPPLSSRLADESGMATHPYHDFFDKLAKTLEILRQAATLMDDLNPSTATTNDIATAWEEFRAKLQEIV